jgi:adenylyltransferase/sulfurtransferase
LRENEVVELSPAELREKLERNDDIQLVDVREQFEWDEVHLDGARLIPMGRFVSEVGSLDREREIVLYCRTGSRSRRVADWLVSQGYPKVANLTGGIVNWEDELGEP